MIKLIILGAIFYVGYQIGANGYEDFVASIDLQAIENKITSIVNGIGNIIGTLNS